MQKKKKKKKTAIASKQKHSVITLHCSSETFNTFIGLHDCIYINIINLVIECA